MCYCVRTDSVSQARHPNPRLVYNMVIGKRTFALQDTISLGSSQRKQSQKFKTPPLFFESRFESGNLMRATQVGERTYDLQLQNGKPYTFQCFVEALSILPDSDCYACRCQH